MSAPAILHPPADGRGKYHHASRVTNDAICGDPAPLNLDPMLAVHVTAGDTPHRVCCRACVALVTTRDYGDALAHLEAARQALTLAATYGGVGEALDFVRSRLRRCTNPGSVLRFVRVHRELERAGA